MKIEINKQILESILINLQSFLEKKDATQITSHILFTTQSNQAIIKATDLEIGLKITTNKIQIIEEGNFTVNGKKLLDIIKILKDEKITLEIIKDILIIKQKHSRFKLPTFEPTAYPTFPKIENQNKISIDSSILIPNLKKISPAIDNNNPKFELNGAYINITSNKIDLVGTDTRRLAISSIQSQNQKILSIIVPKKAILEIQKLFLDNVEIYINETNLIITNQNYLFYTRLINGKYPDYQRIIPKTTKKELSLNKNDMINSIKMITTISQEIKIIFTNKSILFNSLSSDNIEAKTELEVENNINEDFELAFNSKYLLDFLSQTSSEYFVIKFNESSLPFLVQDQDFITIIMPIVE